MKASLTTTEGETITLTRGKSGAVLRVTEKGTPDLSASVYLERCEVVELIHMLQGVSLACEECGAMQGDPCTTEGGAVRPPHHTRIR